MFFLLPKNQYLLDMHISWRNNAITHRFVVKAKGAEQAEKVAIETGKRLYGREAVVKVVSNEQLMFFDGEVAIL